MSEIFNIHPKMFRCKIKKINKKNKKSKNHRQYDKIFPKGHILKTCVLGMIYGSRTKTLQKETGKKKNRNGLHTVMENTAFD